MTMTSAAPTPPGAGAAPGARVLVVVPTYNERDNLGPLVRQIVAHAGYRVMVVDDASPDGTGDLAEELAREFPGRVDVVHRTGQRGLGRSYVEGMQRALAADADLVCQMDADLSHDPKYLPDLVAGARQYDLVIGSRYLHGISVVNWPLRRVMISLFANWYVRAITRLNLRDCTAGFRCWQREALVKIPLDRIASDGYAFQVEMAYACQKKGYRVIEVPIVFRDRARGRSKMSLHIVWEALWRVWQIKWRY